MSAELSTVNTAAPGFWAGLAQNIVTTAGAVVEKKIAADTAAGSLPVNASPYSANSQPSGIVPGISNQTLMLGAGVLVGVVVLVAVLRK